MHRWGLCVFLWKEHVNSTIVTFTLPSNHVTSNKDSVLGLFKEEEHVISATQVWDGPLVCL